MGKVQLIEAKDTSILKNRFKKKQRPNLKVRAKKKEEEAKGH